jgi:hypothetical protein
MAEQRSRYPWLWDVDMGNGVFEALLAGRTVLPQFDASWALLRLVEYAPYAEIKRLLPRDAFLRLWPEIAPRVRSVTRKAGMDFVFGWLTERAVAHA